ncbi:amidohydrolase family protein [Caldibacillus lycopersici]|uniref:Amidohydrolase family protein n=1 Tax=Perspicuibacillus lycopersici TaxID=1325689 RepID=A0AAE3IRD4_9BACI|nr:amidohydrolase family protein [Perspicuibacillus lycopersici]MCU9613036.1 amidohydrolase family protein [Perspicuibacillus lycopersici]
MAFTLVKNATLIDGNGGAPLQDAVVLLKDGVIKAVGTANDVPQVNGEVEVLDAQGGYILPGLFDTHVHMMFEQEDYGKKFQTPFSYNFYKAMDHFKRTIETGITSVRDAGFTDVGVKQAVEEGLFVGPRLQVSINPLTITGGHGDSWTRSGIDLTSPTYPTMPSGIVDGPDAIHQKVREMLRAGADIIKVHATGGVMSPTDHPEFTQFSQEELEIIVREAAFRRGVKVMAHAQGAEGIKNAVRAGIISIEHGIYLDDEAIELMIEHGTYLVPTLLAPVSVLEQFENSTAIPEHAARKSREVIDIHRESFTKAYRAGVKIAMGTDAGVMAHGTNLRELGLMVEGGMTPMEAIVATTKTAAELMGWEDKLGTVEAGKLADLVIVKTNPLEDITSLEDKTNIVTVIKEGKVVKDTRKEAAVTVG